MNTAAVDDFNILHQEVCELFERWMLMNQLFSDEESIELLNESAPAAFGVIQFALVDLIIMGIARLTSDKDSRSLTVKHLLLSYEGTSTGVELSQIVEKLDDLTGTLTLTRNKRIAHHDTDVAKGSFVLPDITKKQIDDSMKLISDFMNVISFSRDRSEIAYNRIQSIGNGTSIIWALKRSSKLEDLQLRAWTEPHEVIMEELRKPH